MEKKSRLSKIIENWIPILVIISIAVIFLKKDSDIRFHDEILIDNLKDTTWAVQELWDVFTWSEININTWTINNTWVTIEIPSNPRELLNYQIEYWEWWVDYIVSSPTNQPNINSKTSKENNEKMHDYLYHNRIRFEIKDLSRKWYIMFVTSKPIKSISNVFIWLDWSTIWWLDKTSENRTQTKKDNEFIYPLSNLDLIWNNDYHFHKDLSRESTISINAVVWEAWNYVEKIIIFFK